VCPAALPRVSLVIPTKDKASRLRLALACLPGQADIPPGAPRPEVIVVNDGSSPDTARIVAQALVGLDLVIVTGPRRGRAAARNAGARHASGDWLVFLDDDILVGPEFLAAHLAAAHDTTFGHGPLRELPAAGRLLRHLDGADGTAIRAARDQLQSGTLGFPFRLVANALERAIEGMAAGSIDDVAPWLGCVGANVAMSRRAWELAGGFDEDFGMTWGCEDLELGFRLRELGLRRVLVPGASGVHLSHPRPGRWEEHQENMGRFLRLHPVPSVMALPVLLGMSGSPEAYVAAVRECTGTASAVAPAQAVSPTGAPWTA
jgi:glycosyltransferase involved in cell wall biosynthesis